MYSMFELALAEGVYDNPNMTSEWFFAEDRDFLFLVKESSKLFYNEVYGHSHVISRLFLVGKAPITSKYNLYRVFVLCTVDDLGEYYV